MLRPKLAALLCACLGCVGNTRPSARATSESCGACPGGTICQLGECLAVCRQDPDCPKSLSCRDGVCVCTDSGDEPIVCDVDAGRICCPGQGCYDESAAPPECAACDCVPGEDCVDGDCSCGGGAACGTGETCDAGVCRCGAGAACATGTCCVGSCCSGTCCGGVCCPTDRVCCDEVCCAAGDVCGTSGCETGPDPCTVSSLADGTECGVRTCESLEWRRRTCLSQVCSQSELVEDCDDNNECTTDGCESASGCSHTLRSERAVCEETGLCTTGGQCVECIALGDCDDSNDCTIDVCEVNGECSHTPETEGTSCEGTRQCNDDGLCVDCLEPADCGTDGWVDGTRTCSGSAVRQDFRTWSCTDGACDSSDSNEVVTSCACGCSGTSCAARVQGWGTHCSSWVCVTNDTTCYTWRGCDWRCPSQQGAPCTVGVDQPEWCEWEEPCVRFTCP